MSTEERYAKIDEQLWRAVNGVANARLLLDGFPDKKVRARAKKNLRVCRDKICDVGVSIENSFIKISKEAA